MELVEEQVAQIPTVVQALAELKVRAKLRGATGARISANHLHAQALHNVFQILDLFATNMGAALLRVIQLLNALANG